MVSLTGPMSSIFQKTNLSSPPPLPFAGFYAGGNPFYVVRNSTVTGSGNLGTWENITTDIPVSGAFNGIAFDASTSTIFGITNTSAFRSVDGGLTWANATFDLPGTVVVLGGVEFAEGIWVLFQQTPGFIRIIYTSPDTLVWTPVFVVAQGEVDIRFTNSVWIGTAFNGDIFQSSSGAISWAPVDLVSIALSTGHPTARFSAGSGLFMTAGQDEFLNPLTITSPDSLIWGPITPVPNAIFVSDIEHFDNNIYVMTGLAVSGKHAWFSVDAGTTWTQVTNINGPDLGGVSSGIGRIGDIIFASHSSGLTYTMDGSSWTLWPGSGITQMLTYIGAVVD